MFKKNVFKSTEKHFYAVLYIIKKTNIKLNIIQPGRYDRPIVIKKDYAQDTKIQITPK